MAEAAYKKLVLKRNNSINAIKHHKTKTDASNKDTKQTEILHRIIQLEHCYERFQKIAGEIIESDAYNEKDITEKDEDIEEMYILALSKLKDLSTDEHGPTLSSTRLSHAQQQPQNNTQIHDNEVRLGKFTLRKFNGEYEHWTTFFDAFTTYVDENPRYSDMSKMYYLRDSLTGTALSVINRLPLTEKNYKLAWKLLTERFHNKRAITNQCLANIINCQKLSQPAANQLRVLIDGVRESLQTLETIEIVIEAWDPIVVHIVESKLEMTMKFEWERSLNGSTEIPSYQQLSDFLETQHRILEAAEAFDRGKLVDSPRANDSRRFSRYTPNATTKTLAISTERCCVCNESHGLYFCPTFETWSVKERKNYIADTKRCENCLKQHNDNCKSHYRCKKCKGIHNTKLHEETVMSAYVGDESNNESVSVSTIHLASRSKLLATAIVQVKDKRGTIHMLRAFIDQGAESAFITERAAQLLCLSPSRENVSLLGVDNVSLGRAKKSVTIEVNSMHDKSFVIVTKALLSRTIITTRTSSDKSLLDCTYLKGITLADPNFLDTENVDLLLGVDIYAVSLLDGIRRGEMDQPVAQNSRFGWLVFGALSPTKESTVRVNCTSSVQDSLSQELQRFWQNEEVNVEKFLTEEQEKCVQFYEATTTRQSNGRYMVSLPYTMNVADSNFLGHSYEIALRRQLNLEKRFRSQPKLREMYNEFMFEYLNLGHMSVLENDQRNGCYLPHHPVLRENSTTTKLRTVFDASAKTTNGFSLNDRLMNGPTIQPELFDTFIRWRVNKIALIADVEKMYRQIDVAPADRINQKVLYRFSETEPMQTFVLNTITYGTKPAPYMGVQTTFLVADDEATKYPIASKCVKTDMYVDDLLSGAESTSEAIELRHQFSDLFNAGHLSLRKWASNDESVLADIPAEYRALQTPFELHKNDDIKTLGIWWNPKTDKLHFRIDISTLSSAAIITKRKLLSDGSKIFDPCGILSPVTIKAKILMQEAWKQGIDWDNNLSPEIQAQWNEYRSELHLLEKVEVKRWLSTTKESKLSLHGFCDSSSKAYCAVIYLVQQTSDNFTSHIVCSKTKVAPIQCESIPRLELCGAVMLCELMERVSKNLKISKERIHLWTDSELVLNWLHSHASNWVTYVANRVSKIQKVYNIGVMFPRKPI